MLENIEVLCHSSIKIKNKKVIYVDPFKIKEAYNDADIIMITHSHYDHYSEEDIEKVRKNKTYIVITKDLYEKVLNLGFEKEYIVIVEPCKEYEIDEIKLKTIPAYNINKKFHPKEKGWVGYIIELDDIKYYIAGDTDITEENQNVKCDVAFIPVGGTYTTTSKEAAQLANIIKPKIAVPTHYGEVVGSNQDAIEFEKNLDKQIKCEIFIK